uniref:Flavin-containing monooxygenase FMO n=1 Tax=Cyanothece sp. (strain PCC 7425 / ATCC 29141) TaxID=395961 RepID=B8HKZ2_CYAP4
MESLKKCVIIGAGLSGLVTAKELLDVGFENIIILESEDDLGGVWRRYCWKSATLTSSKWITEFGSFPMPDDYPDFLTPEQMLSYLQSFVKKFDLDKYIHCGVAVKAVTTDDQGKYEVITDQQIYRDCDFVVLCTGLHGEPHLPQIPGLEKFSGEVIHGSQYKAPEPFKGKRVLCLGLGESGIGINSEISHSAARTIVSATSYTPAPRVFNYTANPFDQMQFWPIGSIMKDYQELLTLGASWYVRLPNWLKTFYVRLHPRLSCYPEPWLPKALIPYHWHGKYWPKPNEEFSQESGNLTVPGTPTDDLFYLIRVGQIIPKGKVVRFDHTTAYFEDGSHEEIDALVLNTGYKSPILSIDLPNHWQYCHQELYKGCFHPDLINLAFVGFVRPTIGSIPAMAEMQARLVAQVFSGKVKLPESKSLVELIKQEATQHAKDCPMMQKRLPHIYFFDRWMEEMAQLIGCRPTIWEYLGSWGHLQAYLLGSPMPLRFRLQGPGAVTGGKERYIARVNKVYGNSFGRLARFQVIKYFLYPYVAATTLFLLLVGILKFSLPVSLGLTVLFGLLYGSVDLFRFFVTIPLTASLIIQFRKQFIKPTSIPNYTSPTILQTDAN